MKTCIKGDDLAMLMAPISNKQMESLLLLQQKILGEIAIGNSHQKTLEDLCRIAESMLPNAVASIMLFNETKEHLVVRAAPNIPIEAVNSLNGLIPGVKSGSCGTAVYENSPQFICDTRNDIRWSDPAFQDFAKTFGIDACWSMPIRGEKNAPIGSFALSSLEKRQPHAFHQKLMATCANIAAIILNRETEEKKLNYLAHYDVLTGLPNRTMFIDRFNQAIAHSKRKSTQIAVCFLDLDRFKPINDMFGHDVGDKLLVEVAKRIQSTIRENDTVSRQGGDEFLLVLGDIKSAIEYEQTLDRIHRALAEPYVIDNEPFNISASSGVTLYPEDNSNLDTLIRHADQAMYAAKQAGRNCYKFFNSKENEKTAYRHTQLTQIQRGLDGNQFQLYYQPKVNMVTGKVYGAEALIRWIDPEKGIIPPLEFLPIVEGTPLEIDIGNWVINEALSQQQQWVEKGLVLQVSINIASYHLVSPDFLNVLEHAMKKYASVPPRSLQLEILESSVLGDINAIRDVIKTCQETLGISVALDDFGTGYSSLTHVRRLSANIIKVDQSFVRDMIEDEEDYAIIDTVIGLARAFNLDVIAEGVETTEQGLMLIEMGCNHAQGYGIAKPMPANDLPRWLTDYVPNQAWLSKEKLA